MEHRVQYDGDGSNAAAAACKVVNGTPASCLINITIDTKMVAPVYVYYELQNFYQVSLMHATHARLRRLSVVNRGLVFQNHRRYVKSRNDNQLAGTIYTSTGDLSACDPLASRGGKILHPCGLIAQSFFNGRSDA